jgi:hypothetical protein
MIFKENGRLLVTESCPFASSDYLILTDEGELYVLGIIKCAR